MNEEMADVTKTRPTAWRRASRFNEDDKALFPEIKHIMQRESKSANEAARKLVDEGKVKGRGAEQSRALRLARAFRRELRRAG